MQQEGVYIHGLFMDGAAWNVSESTIVESAPRKLFSTMPVILVSAVSKTSKKANASMNSSDYGPFGGDECPVYKYAARTDRYKIFSVMLPTKEKRPLHWVLRGVALLCQTT